MAEEHPPPSPDGNFYWDDEAKIWKPVQRRDATSFRLIIAVMVIFVVLACLGAGFIVSRL
jgi:hypothetical protein